MSAPSPRSLGYLAAWVGAAAAAVTVGLFAVTGVGASVRDRGPITGDAAAVQQAIEDREGVATPDPDATRDTRRLEGEYGVFEVTCQGAVAFGDAALPASGWTIVSYEEGPDDDVDAVFASGDRSVELEVYCNGGVATIADQEVKTLPDD